MSASAPSFSRTNAATAESAANAMVYLFGAARANAAEEERRVGHKHQNALHRNCVAVRCFTILKRRVLTWIRRWPYKYTSG